MVTRDCTLGKHKERKTERKIKHRKQGKKIQLSKRKPQGKLKHGHEKVQMTGDQIAQGAKEAGKPAYG